MSNHPEWYTYCEIEPAEICRIVNASRISLEKECRFLQHVIGMSRDSSAVRTSLINFVDRPNSSVLAAETIFLN